MKQSMVLGIVLLLIGVSPGEASVPPSYPERDWRALSTLLADKSISPSWRAPDGRSIVSLQLLYGSEERAIALLKKGKRSGVPYEGLMSLAVVRGSQRMVQTLLSVGETPNAASGQQESPLMEAAYFGHLEIMRMLIKAGADINYVNAKMQGAVHRALQKGGSMAVNILIDAGLDLERYKADELKNSLVFQAIDGGDWEALYLFVERGFELNSRRDDGQTPLTYSVRVLAPRNVIETLLSGGADPCVTNAEGQLPEQLVLSDDKYRVKFRGLLDDECSKSKLRAAQGITYPAEPQVN
jgi:hypothetical protein